ncbi:DegP protease 10 [Prunus dulcis]|uniref:DegP protease 10 n=1 Tax=Prunus dulcis TaxID=3755 RepID=A0A4Y1R8S3_PRUDU|nr:DegP protease 10 [Prunus dulcis]
MLGTSVRALRRLCSSSSVSSINLIKDYTNKVTATARGTSICTCTIGAAKVEDIAASSSSCSSEPLNSEAHNENGPCACPSVAAVHVHLLRNNNKIRRRRLGDRRNNKRSTTDKDAIELALDSVVKIFTVSSSPNYFLPWQNKSQRESMAPKILTNAHVVADHTFVLVRKHGSPAKYRAQVRAVGHECDLAILSVESEEFWNGVNSLELGDIPFLQEAVAVVGYPQGGDNISVTKGVVSRVEPTQYVHGATQLMAIQIDAAINPGNSGGPAIMGNKVAGVAFQNLSGAENIGYIIPVPVIKHFIAGVEESGKYVGFCSLQMMETVPFRNRERITFDHLVSMKKPNETALQPLVPVHQFDKLPSYYIFAGLVFVPLTQPYLHEYGEDWYNTSPRRLCESALREPPKRAGEQLVILSQVLMDDINAGYERLAELQVKKVNGIEVENLKHLCQLVENCSKESVRFDLDDDRFSKSCNFKILKCHRIPSAMSNDLIDKQSNLQTQYLAQELIC